MPGKGETCEKRGYRFSKAAFFDFRQLCQGARLFGVKRRIAARFLFAVPCQIGAKIHWAGLKAIKKPRLFVVAFLL